jgi:hypothetical protein
MNRDIILLIFGGSVLLAFYGLLFSKLFMGGNVELEAGALIAAVSIIIGFYFGSSDKDKNGV